MACQLQTIRVFDGLDNDASVVFGYVDDAGDPLLFDFTNVSRFLLTLAADVPIVLDTDVTASLMADAGNGEIIFKLGQAGIPIGLYIGTLIIYTPAYTNGYLMDSGDGTTLMVDVRAP